VVGDVVQQRPFELKPTSGRPSRTTSETTATIEQSISPRSMRALRIEDLIGNTPSQFSTMRINGS
jgi:hypothetical protein